MTHCTFLTAGGADAGLGHVVEAIAIARRLPTDADVDFIVPNDGSAAAMLESHGISRVSVVPWPKVPAAVADSDPTTLVVDVPDIDVERLATIRAALDGARLVALGRPGATLSDDPGSQADVVVDFSKDVEEWSSRRVEREGTVFLEGPRYFVPRPAFEDYRGAWEERTAVGEALLLFGGSDPSNHTERFATTFLAETDWRLDLVMGPGYRFESPLRDALADYPVDRVRLTRNADDVPVRLATTDVLVTSPGQTMFESLYVGCPLVGICQTDEQASIYGSLPFVHEIDDVEDEVELVLETRTAFRRGDLSTGDVGGGVGEIVAEIVGPNLG